MGYKHFKTALNECSRREFIKRLAEGTGACAAIMTLYPMGADGQQLASGKGATVGASDLKEVMFYRRLAANRIICEICPRECEVEEGERGYCGNKENQGGRYYTLVYGKVCAAHIDPIEKKPLFHYLPGTPAFSLAAAGCNLQCKFCQNWRIAQFRPEEVNHQDLFPEQAVTLSRQNRCPTIAFTYTEPTTLYSYMFDVAKRAREAKIGTVMISNGFINERPLRELCKQITGVKIDLKSFSDKFYRDYCSGELEPVLATLRRLKEIGIWFEIVNLIIPTLNDDPGEIQDMCKWIKAELGPHVPVHFTRFHPMYQIKNLPPTPVKTLESAREAALRSGLHYPYIGNIPGHEGENTYCPSCKKLLIRRVGFAVVENTIQDGMCRYCRSPLPGVWSPEHLNL
ncbi:MAG: AmmeMemoRadiSam system radical SAM enzyme [Deltaproteobacteria bacterium]|nr:AmmeMemoRadiSam system radical SAM enzyme [Deltaproteobacteria bacterium]